uniref:Receptor ligand binding region domain-containing protein n=1 Tax=Panagrolaimus sp. JU765 TaxID=591449 RepID=A0AC34RJC9_9BILA
MATVICLLMKFYDWNTFALVYQINGDGTCDSFQQDMEKVSQSGQDCIISYKKPIDSWAESDIQYTLDMIKMKARIVLMCFDDAVQERRFALKLSEAKMNTAEYVYLLPYTDMKMTLDDKITPWWIDTGSVKDGKDADAESIAKRSLVLSVDTTSSVRNSFTNFSDEVMAHMKSWPFYCKDCNRGQKASPYAATLYDSMYMYGLAVSR